jgi:hypothetical protein
MDNEPIVITGEENTRMASLIALKGALRLETRGMRRRGRSALAIANEAMGTHYRTAATAFPEYVKWLDGKMGR